MFKLWRKSGSNGKNSSPIKRARNVEQTSTLNINAHM